MFCSKCGFKNQPGDTFCQQCGSRLTDATPVAEQSVPATPPTQPVYAPVQPMYARPVIPRANNPVLCAIKDMVASPLYLVAIIAFSASLFFTYLNLLFFNTAVGSTISRLINQSGLYRYFDLNYIWSALEYIKVIGFIATIPTALYAVGMWLNFVAAQKRGVDSMSTSGLTMIKVLQIISLVFTCIWFLIIEALCIVGIIAVSGNNYVRSYGYYDADAYNVSGIAVALLIGVIIGALIGFTLVIIYKAKTISTINTVKNSIRTCNADYKVSGFVGVMNFIIAFFSFFSAFSGGFFGAVSQLCSVTALICFGILIFNYRSKMINLMSPYAKSASGFAQAPAQGQNFNQPM